MSGNYAQDWKPKNLGGTFYPSAKEELKYWASRAGNDPMVSVPVSTLRAAVDFRECGERTTLFFDEDGPLSNPLEIQCREQEGHKNNHYNGYCSW